MLHQLIKWPRACGRWASRRLFAKDDVGASLVEYALLLALIAVVAVGALFALGGSVRGTLTNVSNCISDNGSCTTSSSTTPST